MDLKYLFPLCYVFFFCSKEPRRHYNTIGEGESNLRPNVLRTSILTTWLRSHRFLFLMYRYGFLVIGFKYSFMLSGVNMVFCFSHGKSS